MEVLVATSVAVAAVHALRPLTARAEPLIAGGFGLIHGLAFSTLRNDLSLDRATSLVSLLTLWMLGSLKQDSARQSAGHGARERVEAIH
ncbi:hypothetical protein BH23ACT6_BH23ACT6_20260 [soil metagenome]